MIDVITWRVRYNDGTAFSELDPHPEHPEWEGRGWAEVDLARVALLEIIETASGRTLAVLDIDPTVQTPVFWRVSRREIRVSDGQEVSHQRVHIVGWETDTDQFYCYVFEQDWSLVFSRRNNLIDRGRERARPMVN